MCQFKNLNTTKIKQQLIPFFTKSLKHGLGVGGTAQ